MRDLTESKISYILKRTNCAKTTLPNLKVPRQPAGGFLLYNKLFETDAETALRETKEEVGLDVKIIDTNPIVMKYIIDKGTTEKAKSRVAWQEALSRLHIK